MNPWILAGAAVTVALTTCAAAAVAIGGLLVEARTIRNLRRERRDLNGRLDTYRQWATGHLDCPHRDTRHPTTGSN